MSDVAIGRPSDTGIFRARTVGLLLALGLLGFLGMVVLGAYAPDLRSGRNGGGHALSNAATGYSAIVTLAEATGRKPRILRNPREFDTEDLLVATPERASVNISDARTEREDRPTLFVLPKWETAADPDREDWVRKAGLMPVEEPIGVLSPEYRFTMKQVRTKGEWLVSEGVPASIRFRAPRDLQVITGLETDTARAGNEAYRAAHSITPLIVDGKGGIVLAQLGQEPLFVLADPDLLNNMGMRDLRQAGSALALLDWLNANPPEGIAFDVSFNGFGHSRSPLKLMFEAPFSAMTIAIVATLLLVGIRAFGRFGAIRPRERAIAFGKAALVDNSAALVSKARREARMGARYAAVVRERAARAFGAPGHLRDAALDDYLDALRGTHRFTELVAAAEAATDRQAMLEAAQALHAWKGEKTR